MVVASPRALSPRTVVCPDSGSTTSSRVGGTSAALGAGSVRGTLRVTSAGAAEASRGRSSSGAVTPSRRGTRGTARSAIGVDGFVAERLCRAASVVWLAGVAGLRGIAGRAGDAASAAVRDARASLGGTLGLMGASGRATGSARFGAGRNPAGAADPLTWSNCTPYNSRCWRQQSTVSPRAALSAT